MFFMAKVLAFANQKGGVGKTTSAVNVALSLAVSEVKTLLIDLDPQANATTGLSDLFDEIKGDVYDVLIKETAIKSAITKTEFSSDSFPEVFCLGIILFVFVLARFKVS